MSQPSRNDLLQFSSKTHAHNDPIPEILALGTCDSRRCGAIFHLSFTIGGPADHTERSRSSNKMTVLPILTLVTSLTEEETSISRLLRSGAVGLQIDLRDTGSRPRLELVKIQSGTELYGMKGQNLAAANLRMIFDLLLSTDGQRVGGGVMSVAQDQRTWLRASAKRSQMT